MHLNSASVAHDAVLNFMRLVLVQLPDGTLAPLCLSAKQEVHSLCEVGRAELESLFGDPLCAQSPELGVGIMGAVGVKMGSVRQLTGMGNLLLTKLITSP